MKSIPPMSLPDIIIQLVVIGLCIWGIYSKWVAPRITQLKKDAPFPNLLRLWSCTPVQVVETLPLPRPAPAAHTPVQQEEVEEPEGIETGSDTWEEQEDDTEEEEEEIIDEDEGEWPQPTAPARSVPVGPPAPRPVHLKPVSLVQATSSAATNHDTAWERWMERVLHGAIHLIVIGSTNAGKTTVLQVFVESLVASGVPVVVCDPDAAAGDWPNTELHGGGDNFEAINLTLLAIQQEAKARRQARADGQRTFAPLWLVLDEYADIKDECGRAGPVVENLLRRARKLNIHLVIGVQDTQVKTMGFERRSQLLQNARTVSLKVDSLNQRYASVDDERAIRIPYLTPQQGTTANTHLAPVVSRAPVFESDGDGDGDGDLFDAGIGDTVVRFEDIEDEPVEDKDESIRRMLAAGRSYSEIASALHVATTRISKVKKDFMLES